MVDSPRVRATSLSSSCTCRDSSRVGHNTIIDTELTFLILPVRSLELPFSFARPRSLVVAGMPDARVLPVPIRDRPMISRTDNNGTKALDCTGLKLVIPLPDSTSVTLWVHPFLVQYGFDVKVNLGSQNSILDSTYTPSSNEDKDDDDDPSRRPPST